MTWRIALIDSCGSWPGALDAAAFVSDGGRVERREPTADGSGHGSRIAGLFAAGDADYELMLGQVFLGAVPASGAAVAAAIDWAMAGGANLLHLSLGLQADRAVLAGAVERAVRAGCIIVAATPARGALVYPAAYGGVVRATGDARCAPGEVSCLGAWRFGGCARFEGSARGDVGGSARSGAGGGAESGGVEGGVGGGASVGAAWITRSILCAPKCANADEAVAALTAEARYFGRERRTPAAAR